MPKLTEFYPELQGRPESKVMLDLEQRQPSIPDGLLVSKLDFIVWYEDTIVSHNNKVVLMIR